MRVTRIRWIVGALLLLLGTHSLEAQRDATIGGMVVDENGEVLVGVVVTVYSPIETRSDTTNKRGRFRVIVMDVISVRKFCLLGTHVLPRIAAASSEASLRTSSTV